jgi:hypothetical protein
MRKIYGTLYTYNKMEEHYLKSPSNFIPHIFIGKVNLRTQYAHNLSKINLHSLPYALIIKSLRQFIHPEA